jgi:hypothetical protein
MNRRAPMSGSQRQDSLKIQLCLCRIAQAELPHPDHSMAMNAIAQVQVLVEQQKGGK